MDSLRVCRVAGGLLIAAALLLFVDLFLDWQQTNVQLPVLQVETGASGWHGWGVVAGIGALGLVAWEGSRRLAPQVTPAEALGSTVLALLVLGSTIAAFQNAVEVEIGVVRVGVGGRTWAAYAGLVLACTVAGAALVRLGAATRRIDRAQSPRPPSPAAG